MTHIRAYPVLLTLLFAPPAYAQYSVIPTVVGNVVGNMVAANVQARCMGGATVSEREVDEAREATTASMAQYFAAAQSGAGKASTFHLDGKASLTVVGAKAGKIDIERIIDPLADRGNTLSVRPVRFFRSGMDASALGQWAVLRADGTTAGVYTVLFARKAQVWKPSQMIISVPGEKVAPAMQFCHAPGDVTKYKLESAANMREQFERRLVKAQKQLDDAMRRQPDSAEVARWRAEVNNRQIDLARARTMEQEAQEEERAIARSTVDAADAARLSSAG